MDPDMRFAPTITWTLTKLKAFKQELSKAEVEGANSIRFEGHEVLVSFGRYLVLYLEGRGL